MNENNENKQIEIDENAHTYKTIEAKPVFYPDDANFFFKNKLLLFITKFLVFIVGIFLIPFGYLFLGLRVKGKKKIKSVKKQGAIIISNHVHPLDSFYLVLTRQSKRIWVTSLMSNMGLPFFGKFVRLLAAVPIPETREGLRNFSKQMAVKLEKGDQVVIFPEAALKPFCDHIRPFKKGAFTLAMRNDVPIIPVVYTFHRAKGPFKWIKRKPCIHLNYLDPYYPPKDGSRAQNLEKAMNDLNKIMSDFFNETTTYNYVKKEKK